MNVSRRAFTTGLALTPLARGNTSNPQDKPVPASKIDSTSTRFFDNHQLETVAVLADLIIPATDTPGARAAQVHLHLDSILADSPQATQTQFLEGLWRLDGYCLRSESAPFKDVAPDKQMQILLRLHDTPDPELTPGHTFVHEIKIWTARIYYSTEVGERELNKGSRVPSTYTRACEIHPSS
jgi:gluconate 2-dehydrogenase gamma chain